MSFKLIVLEGLDRSGKTTVSSMLQQRLQPCTIIRFPNRATETGKLLDKFLKKQIKFSDHTIHLLYSANRYEEETRIRDLLKSTHVICDRYWLSGAVYSTAKGLDFEWCKSTDKLLPQPDFTFFLDVPVEETSKRTCFGNEVHDKIEFQRKVYEIYKSKVEEEGVYEINGLQEPEKIVEAILECLKP
ncbi:thymidylate kinase [Vittaforma corneae ATCC 50505]|uniref:dTMP kinase n=1 Tax=Vittaforma corneae (strain ATCC 50505) TaxID=993615 RepID=L2GPD6_VITCO|nr:thymidylate kinase [Vittaforma corneae ATCC 50505]ELA42162.1 thymidylate kinase [Vittaforma corneae ATCC 50505]